MDKYISTYFTFMNTFLLSLNRQKQMFLLCNNNIFFEIINYDNKDQFTFDIIEKQTNSAKDKDTIEFIPKLPTRTKRVKFPSEFSIKKQLYIEQA